MTYSVPPTKTASDLIQSSDWNTYVRDNMEEIAYTATCSALSTTAVTLNTGLGVAVGSLVWDTAIWDSGTMLVVPRSEIQVPDSGRYEVALYVTADRTPLKATFAVYTSAGIGQPPNTNYSSAQPFYPVASLPYWHGTKGEGHLMASGTVNCNANDVIRANVTFGTAGVSPVPNARIVVTRTLF
jgi:hypothetical protein